MKIYLFKEIIAILFLAFSINVKAQIKSTAFSAIDKRIKTISSLSADTLAHKLTYPYKTDIEKVRAIYRWITENIAYDVNGYHNVAGIYDDLWQLSLDSENVDSVYNSKIVAKILKEKRAVCDGYSRLFKTLCDHARIKCAIITGYIRWSTDPIGAITNRGHAWNAVYINNSWKLIDATWASGYTDHGVTKFIKHYDEFFFFTNPIHFFNDHYPTDNKWSLMPITPSLNQFYNFPFYYPAFYKFKVISLKPTTGYIDVTQKNRIVHIELELDHKVDYMYAYEYSVQNPDSIIYSDLTSEPKFTADKKKLVYSYEIKSDRSDKLSIVLNNERILTYGVRVRKY